MRARTRGAGAIAVIVMTLLMALTACSGGGTDSMSSDGGSTSGGSGAAADSEALTDAPRGSALDGLPVDGDSPAAGRTQVQTRAVISTGNVELKAEDLGEVRAELDRLLGRFGGYIAREQTENDKEGRTSSATMQLRVPAQHFDTMMGSFAEFATVVHTSRKEEDVTTEVIDVASRIRTQEISLERLRTFLGRATKVADMIRLEAEIAEREADLGSLRAQQDFLDDQTSLATINVRMYQPDADIEEDDPLADAGFLTGLRNGWEALTDVAVVGATAVGAVLPFVGVLALLVVPLVVWLRVGRRRRAPVEPAPPTAG